MSGGRLFGEMCCGTRRCLLCWLQRQELKEGCLGRGLIWQLKNPSILITCVNHDNHSIWASSDAFPLEKFCWVLSLLIFWCLHRTKINSSRMGKKKRDEIQKSLCLTINPKDIFKIILIILVLCRHSLKVTINNVPRYLLNYRRRFMYLQTLGFLMTQLSKVPKKSQKTFAAQNLSSRVFCNDGNVLCLCCPL